MFNHHHRGQTNTQGDLEEDVEKLLRKQSPRLSSVREQNQSWHPCPHHHGHQVTEQPASEEEKWDGGDLEKSETGDSGTCVDEILSPGPLGASKEDYDEEERKAEEDYEEVFEAEDLVQLTVSSLASLGMLEDVPEHADEDNSELADEQATVG